MALQASPAQAAVYNLQASFMELMEAYLSGRLSAEEYVTARRGFFQEHFPLRHQVDRAVVTAAPSSASDYAIACPEGSMSRWLRG